jgi:hypothetical protein
MPSDYRQLRAAVLGWIKSHPKDQLSLTGIPTEPPLVAYCRSRGITPVAADLETIQQIFHELYLERIIVPGSGPAGFGPTAMSWPSYRLTEYGKKVLDVTEYVPFDPEGYLSRLKTEIPSIDRDAIRYLDEGLGCFRSGFFLGAAVMVGCAAERILLLLVDAFGRAIADSGERQQYEKETAFWMIGRKYEAMWKRLEPKLEVFPKPLADDLQVTLDRTFDLIRTTRNAAGHPTGKVVERETVYANLTLFPIYSKRVYSLFDYLKTNTV